MNSTNIVDLSLYKSTKWFVDSFDFKLLYYDELLRQFELVESKSRFAAGCNFVCKNCSHTAGLVIEDAAFLWKSFIVTKVVCVNCGNRWSRIGIKPLWQQILEDFDIHMTLFDAKLRAKELAKETGEKIHVVFTTWKTYSGYFVCADWFFQDRSNILNLIKSYNGVVSYE